MNGHPSAPGQAQDRDVCWPKTDVLPLCHINQVTGRASSQQKPVFWNNWRRREPVNSGSAGKMALKTEVIVVDRQDI